MRDLLLILCALSMHCTIATANERVNGVLRLQILADAGRAAIAATDPVADTLGSGWISHADQRLRPWIADDAARDALVRAVRRESIHARLDPDLLLSIIQIESTFRPQAVSPKGAIGYMQVMPFWTKAIGRDDHNLFEPNLNLRYGTVILRHYIEIERGDLARALARYKGTPDRIDYSKMVIDTWRQWRRHDLPAPREPVRVAQAE